MWMIPKHIRSIRRQVFLLTKHLNWILYHQLVNKWFEYLHEPSNCIKLERAWRKDRRDTRCRIIVRKVFPKSRRPKPPTTPPSPFRRVIYPPCPDKIHRQERPQRWERPGVSRAQRSEHISIHLKHQEQGETSPKKPRIHIPKHQPRAHRDYNHNRPYGDGEHLQPPPPRNLRRDKAVPLISTSLSRNLLKNVLTWYSRAAPRRDSAAASLQASTMHPSEYSLIATSSFSTVHDPRLIPSPLSPPPRALTSWRVEWTNLSKENCYVTGV